MPCGGHPESGHGPGRGMPWPMAYERNQPSGSGWRPSKQRHMHACPCRGYSHPVPWALAQPQGRRARPLPGAGRATARVRATGKRTSRDGDVCTDAGSERPAGDAGGSLIAPFVRRPAHVKSIESPPHPHPHTPALVVALFPLRCSRRPVASLPIITAPPPPHAKRPNATPFFFGEREREAEPHRSPSSPLLHAFCPVASRPSIPLSHFTRSRSRVVARPACAKCYRYLYRLASRRVASAVTRPAGPRRRPRSWPGTKTDLLLPVLRLV